MARGTIAVSVKKAWRQLVWGYVKWLLLLALAAYFFSGIYKVEQDKIGVLTRFGQVVEPAVPPGLHYKLPWPVDRIQPVSVKQVKTLSIQDFGSKFKLFEGGASYRYFKATDLEPYCITGDNNIVAITMVLKYTIEDPVRYLYQMKGPETFIERSAANIIVRQLAHLKIDDVLTVGKKQLEFDLQNELLAELERYDTGIRISFLEIKEITPPRKVQDSFDRVINAEVNKKKALNQAQGYANRVVPEARSQANREIQEARAYKREKILTAEGEASRFLARYREFSENPDAHQEKIYLEFIRELYPRLGSVRVVDSRQNRSSAVVVPLVGGGGE